MDKIQQGGILEHSSRFGSVWIFLAANDHAYILHNPDGLLHRFSGDLRIFIAEKQNC
ncbi:hypothetical protein [Bradyrhizobium sp. RDI18]|uniref:hypothetical protein n=1 Tax=Bradyrhizobium sp. RDI18 TaxID=3367400 RepID=UPI00372080CA